MRNVCTFPHHRFWNITDPELLELYHLNYINSMKDLQEDS
jgi:hypothetical protein